MEHGSTEDVFDKALIIFDAMKMALTFYERRSQSLENSQSTPIQKVFSLEDAPNTRSRSGLKTNTPPHYYESRTSTSKQSSKSVAAESDTSEIEDAVADERPKQTSRQSTNSKQNKERQKDEPPKKPVSERPDNSTSKRKNVAPKKTPNIK